MEMNGARAGEGEPFPWSGSTTSSSTDSGRYSSPEVRLPEALKKADPQLADIMMVEG